MITPDKTFNELAQDYCNMPEPIPLDANKENTLPYPVELLPDDVKETVLSYQEYGQQPLSMIATSALATLSLACQGLANVARDEQLVSPVSLDTITVSDSGDRKTAGDNFFSEPIREWESNKIDELDSEFKNRNADIMTHQLKKEGIKSEIKRKIAKGNDVTTLQDRLRELEKNEPQKIMLPKLFHEEVTPEALAHSLATGYQSSSLWSNEAGIIVGSQAMRPEHLLKTITLLNRLWDGGIYRVDRRTSDNFKIEGRRLTSSLMMQPLVFNQFINRCGDIARGSGFLARNLIVIPKSTMGTRFYKEPPSNINNQAFRQRILQLLDVPLPLDNKGRLKPEILRLTSEAKKIWIEFYNETEAQLASGKEYGDIQDFASKAAENAARIAAIFHLFEDKKGLINEEITRRACGVMAWYLLEIKHIILNNHVSQENQDAKILIDWLVKNNFRTYKIADLLRNAPNKLRNKQRRDKAMYVLESHNYITVGANEIIINSKCWSNNDV
jgi:hypothetical protein